MDRGVMVWTVVLLVSASAGCITAQSGEDSEDNNVVCFSHISKKGNSLTCRTVVDSAGEEDDEEDEDQIVRMTACCNNTSIDKTICMASEPVSQGHIIRGLAPITAKFHLTIQLKTRDQVKRTVDLAKIVKPDTPQANITFPSRSNKAVILVWSPYEDDYLKATNQLFQLRIWSATESQVYNMTSQPLVVEREYRQNTRYQVSVRAIPNGFIKGTWSDWSEPQHFNCAMPREAETTVSESETDGGHVLLYILTVTLVMLFLTTWGAVFLWRRKISTYVWPDIPHPKQTFVQIYKPVKGSVLVSFEPEAFLDLAVYPVERVWDPASGGGSIINLRSDKPSMLTQQQQPGSRPLSLPGGGPGVPPPPGGGLQSHHDPEHGYALKSEPDDVQRRGSKDEAYVTMSSFYHVK